MAAPSYIGRTDIARGIRNNNPGNIKAEELWQGQIGTDGPFVVFKDQDWGLRALATDLGNKIKNGYDTIRKIVSRYAPPEENNTQAYIQSVVDDSGFTADQVIPANAQSLALLMRAIINHENGEGDSYDYVADADIANGIAMLNDKLKTFFDAVGIAVAVPFTTDGQTDWGKVAVVGLVAAVGIYFLIKKK
jgi:hypothetical protein